MTSLDRLILAKLSRGGPAYKRAYSIAKTSVNRLIEQGLIEAISPPQGRAKNMIAITAAGRAAIGQRASSAQGERVNG